MFQFHKGAIKTVYAYFFYILMMRFNSIKVRLRRDGLGGVVTIDFGFNSIKVRLRRHRLGNEPVDNLFQFHKGAIKTLIDTWGEAPISAGFRMQRYENYREKYVDVE